MRSAGAEVIFLEVGRIRYLNPLIIYKMIKIIKDKGISLIHTDSTTETFYAGIAAKITRIPLIWHVRVSEREWLLDRILTILAKKIILVAHALISRFLWLSDSKKIVVIHNGIDLEEFDTAPSDSLLRETGGIGRDEILLGCIGRLERRKGQEDLLLAMKDIENAKLILVGGGDEEYKIRLQDLCRDLGITDRVFFLGQRDDIPALLRAIDIIVFPSREGEGFPRVILEAMAAGRPVIATDNAGISEAVVDGVTGYIVSEGDPSSMAAKIKELIANKALREEMGERGRKRVEGLFTIQRHVEGVQGVYRELLKGRWG